MMAVSTKLRSTPKNAAGSWFSFSKPIGIKNSPPRTAQVGVIWCST